MIVSKHLTIKFTSCRCTNQRCNTLHKLKQPKTSNSLLHSDDLAHAQHWQDISGTDGEAKCCAAQNERNIIQGKWHEESGHTW